MSDEFFDHVDRLKFRDVLDNSYYKSTEKAYKDFGLVYGQTVYGDAVKDTLKVKVKNKQKWIWAKMKFSL